MSKFNEVIGSCLNWLKDIKDVCPSCEGKGKKECDCDKVTRIKKCWSCNGKGYKLRKSEQKETNSDGICDACNGKKIAYCSICDGTGKVWNQNAQEVRCIECLGKGLVECSTCKGTGKKTYEITKMVETKETCSLCNGRKEIECKECDTNHEKKCSKCGGKGTVYKKLKIFLFIVVIWFIISRFL